MDLGRKVKARTRWTMDLVRDLFTERGCVLLETRYQHNQQILRYVCPAGHECAQSLGNFSRGHGCALCRNARRWAGRRLDLAKVAASIEDEGYFNVKVWRDDISSIRISYSCQCGGESTTAYHHFRRGRRCGKCASNLFIGEGNPRYNPSLSDEDRERSRKHPGYVAWRGMVFERDNFTCRRCDSGGLLNAHHINNYSSNVNLRLVVDNGITLCKPCHTGFHASHGYGDNDMEQLQSYMEEAWA